LKKIFFLISVIILFTNCALAKEPKIETIIPRIPSSESDDALATTINPAGLGIGRPFNGYYFRTYYGDSSKDDAIFIESMKTGFSAEFVTSFDDIDFNRYTLSSGGRLTPHFYWGTGYSWYTSEDKDYDKLSSWDIGFLYRRRYISLGVVGKRVNHPEFRNYKLPRKYDFSLALRPMTPRITISASGCKTEDVDDIDLNFSLRLEPFNGLIFRGNIDKDKNFDLMLKFTFSNIGLGSYNRFNSVPQHVDGVGYFYLSQAQHNRFRKRRYLKVTPESIDLLKRAKDDKTIEGAVLRMRKQYGFGDLQQFHDKVTDFRASGKKVLFYSRSCSTGSYFLASGCNMVIMHPSADLNLIGIRSESTFVKNVLDKIGINANFEKIGKYKSAPEQFTRNGMSDASRENENLILDDLYEQLTSSIAEERHLDINSVKKLIDSGPYTAKEAKFVGLIDNMLYEDQLDDAIKIIEEEKIPILKAEDYSKEKVYKRDWQYEYPKIACIHAEGLMTTGESYSDIFTGMKIMGSDTISKAIEKARQDDSIKAIVLRIDSGGGMVIAADIIWRQVMLTKDKKPIVVSMGNAAASGGYYISAPADVIVAEPGTITGSIGVFSGRYNLKSLYEKIGVNKVILKRGEHADFFSDYSEYTEYKQTVIAKQVKEIYDSFLEKVARARNMSKSQVHEVAQGRVWTGKQAKEIGLIDRLGGIDLAIEIAKERAGIPKEKEVEIVSMPEKNWFLNLLELEFLDNFRKKLFNTELISILSEQKVWLLMPSQIEIN